MKSLLLFAICLAGVYGYAQNVGIGISSPTARLHIKGNVKIEGSNMLDFGSG